MNEHIADLACLWISQALPVVSLIKGTVDIAHQISDAILFEKLYNVMCNQDSDFDEWLKVSENFQEDSSSYQKMVRQIIYNINAINDYDMLYAYSNLLKAYKQGYINKNDFFRLGFCLTRLLSQDATFLMSNINRYRIAENIYCLSLSSNNLMYNQTRGFDNSSNEEETDYYCFTDIGKMLDKYALSFGDKSKHNYDSADEPLSNQKLDYSYMDLKPYDGSVTIKDISLSPETEDL